MPSLKDIRGRIGSVRNIAQITRAMEMVAASKMRRAQERMRAARPYGEKIRNVAAHISYANPEYRHPFLVTRDTVKKVGIILITTDKGHITVDWRNDSNGYYDGTIRASLVTP